MVERDGRARSGNDSSHAAWQDSVMPTPVTIADIDAAWLADALDADLESIEVHPIAAGEGFMGQLARVSIVSSAPGVPRSVIVKLPTADPGGRAIGEMMRVWEREHCFYRDVAGQLNIRVPKAYVNTIDPPCLVLEDLAMAPYLPLIAALLAGGSLLVGLGWGLGAALLTFVALSLARRHGPTLSRHLAHPTDHLAVERLLVEEALGRDHERALLPAGARHERRGASERAGGRARGRHRIRYAPLPTTPRSACRAPGR
jgi:hypothetical protein